MYDRKFMVWKWDIGPASPEVEIEVRVKYHENPTKPGVKFYVKQSDPVSFTVESTDIEELRAKVDEHLRDFHTLDTEPWLAVKFDLSHREGKAALTVEIEEHEEGTRPSDGAKFHRSIERRYGQTDWSNWGRGPITETYEATTGGYTFVRDTPENRAALTTIMEGVKQLGQRLKDFLAQDDVEAALADMATSGIMKLAAPEPSDV